MLHSAIRTRTRTGARTRVYPRTSVSLSLSLSSSVLALAVCTSTARISIPYIYTHTLIGGSRYAGALLLLRAIRLLFRLREKMQIARARASTRTIDRDIIRKWDMRSQQVALYEGAELTIFASVYCGLGIFIMGLRVIAIFLTF